MRTHLFGLTVTASLLLILAAGLSGCRDDGEPAAVAAQAGDKESGLKSGKADKGRKAEKAKAARKADKESPGAATSAAPDNTEGMPGPANDAARPSVTTGVPGKPAQAADTAAQGQLPAQAQPVPNPAVSPTLPEPVRETAAPARPDPSRPALADPRLLMTLADVSAIAPPKTRFQRVPLAGLPRTEDTDSIMYRPEKGDSFGFALQLFRSRSALETKKRFDSLQAAYPSAQEISSVSGKTFFSYWNDSMHIGFVHPAKNLVAVVSCGRQFCNSDKLMELSLKIAERLK